MGEMRQLGSNYTDKRKNKGKWKERWEKMCGLMTKLRI